MAQNKDQKRPSVRRRTLGLIVASTVATAPFGCDDSTQPPMDAGTMMAALDAAASEARQDAVAASDSGADADEAGDAAQDYPAGVRG